MNWILLANTGNYPATNYVNLGMIMTVLLIVILGVAGIIRNSGDSTTEEEGR